MHIERKNTTMNESEKAKVAGDYYRAGRLQAESNKYREPCYGCHYGMRSTRDSAREEFARGFWDAKRKD